MPTLKLNIIFPDTHDLMVLMVADASVYPTDPPSVTSPILEVTPPAFDTVSFNFLVNDFMTFNSQSLGITSQDQDLVALPDGLYRFKYSVAPAFDNYVEKTLFRVDKLQERFDQAFMKLDMMECDRALKLQSKMTLNTIYYMIQGAIAAANNCALIEAEKLYAQASRMLKSFTQGGCGCSGTNYISNFN